MATIIGVILALSLSVNIYALFRNNQLPTENLIPQKVVSEYTVKSFNQLNILPITSADSEMSPLKVRELST